MHKSNISSSSHFTLHELDSGIYAAIAQDGGAAICNAGLIDLGGQSIVFDTCLTPQAAADLRRAAIELFGHEPQVVINSHYHNDHIWGNQAFPEDTQIISTARTRQLIVDEGGEELRYYAANAAAKLADLRLQYDQAQDEAQRQGLSMWLGYYSGLVEALPTLSVRLPNITFTDRLTLHGSLLSAELLTFDGAHTQSDTVLHLPQAGILFMSDLLFVGCHPYLADGDPLQLRQALEDALCLDATRFVPGHGPLGAPDDLRLLIAYIDDCLHTAQQLTSRGVVSDEQLASLTIGERFAHWQLPRFFQANMRFMCQYVTSSPS